jgi:hypothetical protein
VQIVGVRLEQLLEIREAAWWGGLAGCCHHISTWSRPALVFTTK